MALTPTQAEALIDAQCHLGELWPLHSRQVAKVSLRIADALAEVGQPLDREALHIQALVHDIGRSRTHGPLHGWTGFVLMRSLGEEAAGRGCLTHWLKGRSHEEVAAVTYWRRTHADRVFQALSSHPWDLLDTVLSYADSSVQHTTIVPIEQRHADLLERYGESTWMRRAVELAEAHGAEIDAALGFEVAELLSPLFGDTLHDEDPPNDASQRA